MEILPQETKKNSLIPDLEKTKRIYTVSEITQDIKIILENALAEVWVEGEVSGIRKISTGTLFFTLKDDSSILKCVMFASSARTVKFEIKDGLKVICFGHVGVYEKEGLYQLYVENLEPKGIGSLQLALEQLKQRLEKEGLFRAEHKRTIPYLPSCIGVVTSLQGAAIKDILKVLERRFADTRIIITSVRVQGEGAKEEIAQAIGDLNQFNQDLCVKEKIEVLIVGRGGGSIEDLWAFNEEIVARAIYNSRIPVISAVGHERDWTIADLVADLRAATPSVAAELVIPKKEELRDKLEDLAGLLKRALLDITADYQETLNNLTQRLKLLSPAFLIQQYKTKAKDLARQIYVRTTHLIKLKESEFARIIGKLSGLSPLNVLSRGYSITFKMPEGLIIKEARLIKAGDTIKTKLHKGEILSQVREVNKNGGNKI